MGHWALGNGYIIMFVAMLIEGPVITAAGALGAVLGYFNIWAVFLLSILGNLIPDAIYYAIGFWGRQKFVDKYGKYFRISPEKIKTLEELYHKHAGKALFAIKMIPLVATPGLIIAGVARVPIRKYIWWSVAVTIPSSLIFLLIGYYSGAAYGKIVGHVNYGGELAAAAIIVFVIISYFWKKISGKIGEKITKI